jgi:hypothetical protein
MPTIKLELEKDIYSNLIGCGVDIEKEFKRFLLKNKSEADNIVDSGQPTNYWDALDIEVQAIKAINSKIFN